MEQAADRVFVSLEVENGTGGDVTNVVPRSPVVQIEADTEFILGERPSPRSYPELPEGSAVTFRWQGRLSSPGAVGISASASAMAGNGEPVETAQVDCGTIGESQNGPEEPVNGSGEATRCAACHSSPHMAFVVSKWRASGHASSYGPGQGNTYCATCHSPLQAEPGATLTRNATIPEKEWQGVTCSACHPPQAQRVEWNTPIAIYDVATGTYTPVPVWDANELCTHCHSGEHAPVFQSYGRVMFYAGVRCIDCHMAKIPADDPNVGQRAAHDFKVAANLPYSCGTYPGGCHVRRPEAWAAKHIAAGRIHAPQQAH